PRSGPRQSSPEHRRDERPVETDGAHRTGRSMQPRAPHLVPMEHERSGQAVHSRPMRPQAAPIAAAPSDAADRQARDEGRQTPVLICLAGPTASGKSAAALALAHRWPIEIIAMDSATIYRGMDIGTAKPSATERAQARHHLIDIRDPAESYSA